MRKKYLCDNRSLTRNVLHQCQLTEVVAFLVGQHRRLLAVAVHFSSCEFAHHYDVELIASLALADDHFVGFDVHFLQDVSDLTALVAVHLLENLDLREDRFVVFAFFLRCFLNDVVERQAIQSKEGTRSLTNDRRGSGCIVEQSQFSERLPRFVGLKQLLSFWEGFEAVQFARIHHVEHIAVGPLGNDLLTRSKPTFLHCTDHDVSLFFLQAAEEETFFESL